VERAEAGQRCAELQAAYEAKVRAQHSCSAQLSKGLTDFLVAAARVPPCGSPAVAHAMKKLCCLWTEGFSPAEAAVQCAIKEVSQAFIAAAAGASGGDEVDVQATVLCSARAQPGGSVGTGAPLLAAAEKAADTARCEVTRLQRSLATERAAATAMQAELQQQLKAASNRALSAKSTWPGSQTKSRNMNCDPGANGPLSASASGKGERCPEERIQQLEQLLCEAQAQSRRAAENSALVCPSTGVRG
jgi:hypothetical protein